MAMLAFLADRAEHERAMAAIRRKYWMFRPIIALGAGSHRHGHDERQRGIVRGHVESIVLFTCGGLAAGWFEVEVPTQECSYLLIIWLIQQTPIYGGKLEEQTRKLAVC